MNIGQALSNVTVESCKALRAKPYQKGWEKDMQFFFRTLKHNKPEVKELFRVLENCSGMNSVVSVLLVLDLIQDAVSWNEVYPILSSNSVRVGLIRHLNSDSDIWPEKLRLFFNEKLQVFLANYFVFIGKDFGEDARKGVITFLRVVLEAEGTL